MKLYVGDELLALLEFTTGTEPCRTGDSSKWVSDLEEDQRDAVAACQDCPIRMKCLTYAIHHDETGVWGGMTEDQREALKLKRRGGGRR